MFTVVWQVGKFGDIKDVWGWGGMAFSIFPCVVVVWKKGGVHEPFPFGGKLVTVTFTIKLLLDYFYPPQFLITTLTV